IEGRTPPEIATRDERIGLYMSPVTVSIFEDGRRRKIKAGEVFWRAANGALCDVCVAGPYQGLIDIIWRESVKVGGKDKFIQRDRQKILLLPPAAVIKGLMTKADRAEINISGLDRWRVDVGGAGTRGRARRQDRRHGGATEIHPD